MPLIVLGMMPTIGWVSTKWFLEPNLSDESVEVIFPEEQLELEDMEHADVIDLFPNNAPSLIFSFNFLNSPTTDSMTLWLHLFFSKAEYILFSTRANLSLKHEMILALSFRLLIGNWLMFILWLS